MYAEKTKVCKLKGYTPGDNMVTLQAKTEGCYWPVAELNTNLNPDIGSAVLVHLDAPCHTGDEFLITLEFETNDDQQAAMWLTPDQTVGKRQPYVLTQCESIYCRSFAPLQDTPAIKVLRERVVVQFGRRPPRSSRSSSARGAGWRVCAMPSCR